MELATTRINSSGSNHRAEDGKFTPFVLSDCIYVKSKESMVKVIIHDILFIEAERNYSRIHAKDKDYVLVMPLKELESKLPKSHFLRVHRSYIANVTKIDQVAQAHIMVSDKLIPLSKIQKDELLKRLPTI